MFHPAISYALQKYGRSLSFGPQKNGQDSERFSEFFKLGNFSDPDRCHMSFNLSSGEDFYAIIQFQIGLV